MEIPLDRVLFKEFLLYVRDLGGTVVTHSPPTSEVSSLNPGPYVRKLVVSY